MDPWSAHTPVSIKFENSPAESLLSTPDEMYPSLFGNTTPSAATMNPIEIMTPPSTVSEADAVERLALTEVTSPQAEAPQTPGADNQEKKPVKKRKSWGQVLPEPKTNLPPRKRAKTEDEKEQRRVERVLRNRRAAQSSRERKRQEVEALEKRTQQLEAMLRQSQATNQALLEELQKFRRESGIVGRGSGFDTLGQAPVTLSQPLFGAQGQASAAQSADSIEQFLSSIPSNQNTTVNPASLSPTLAPIPEDEKEEEEEDSTAAVTPLADATVSKTVGATADATQHPAAMLLSQDLQCPSAQQAPPSRWLLASQQPQPHPAQLLQFLLTFTSAMVSVCQRPLTQIAMSSKAGFSLPPAPAILNTIIWLVTTPQGPSRSRRQTSTSTSTTSSPTISSRSNHPTAARQQSSRSSTLRLKSLRKILTCSPDLARPLMDATLAALRLASSEVDTRVDQAPRNDVALADASANGMNLSQQKRPSKEVLLTLLWVLQVEERRLQIRNELASGKRSTTTSVPSQTTTPTTSSSYILKVLPRKKRGLELEQNARPSSFGTKRNRFD